MNGDVSQGGDGIISNALVENNIIYNNGLAGGSGINCDGVKNSRFQNNLLYNNHASGISLYQTDASGPSVNDTVVNNTILEASDARWCINIKSGSTGTILQNNILYNYHSWHGSIDLDSASLPGLASDYNIVMDRLTPDDNTVMTLAVWSASTGQDTHSLVAVPTQLFVNTTANDYHLFDTCVAVDRGTSKDAPATDIEGTPRPQGKGWDIGAYEAVTGTGQVVNRIVPHTFLGGPVGLSIVDLRGRIVAAGCGERVGELPFTSGYYVERFNASVANRGIRVVR